MVRVLFPELSIPQGWSWGEPITEPRRRLANPKAVAAQTFCAPAFHPAYHDSGVWHDLAGFFERQHAIEPLAFTDAPEGTWIAFPWALAPEAGEGSCAIWMDQGAQRTSVRHVRLFSRPEDAAAANAQLQQTLERAIPLAN